MLDYLMSKYGIRMDMKELSTELKVPENTLRNKFSKIRMEMNIYRDGKKIFANTEDVANYLKSQTGK